MSKAMNEASPHRALQGPGGRLGIGESVHGDMLREAVPLKGPFALWQQNKPRGFACVSCSYGQARHISSHFEFCENGAKATAWEITDKRCPPEFFAEHTVAELESWSDLRSGGSRPADAIRCVGTRRATNTCRSPGPKPLPPSAPS